MTLKKNRIQRRRINHLGLINLDALALGEKVSMKCTANLRISVDSARNVILNYIADFKWILFSRIRVLETSQYVQKIKEKDVAQ